MTHPYCYFNGKIIPVSKARIAPDDLGIIRGYGAFDFSRTYNGNLFHPKEHYQRFVHSAKTIGLKVPISYAEYEQVLLSLLKKNKVKDASFRIIMTGGSGSPDMLTPAAPTLYIIAEPIYTLPEAYYKKGVKLIIKDHLRYAPVAKTTNYIEAVRLQQEKTKQKAYEILYTANGHVLECATSNFFIIKGNSLITSSINILDGITRRVVLEIAKNAFTVEERPLVVGEIQDAEEAFITGTNKKILPVVKIDDITIGNGKVGEKTKLLQTLFEEYVNSYWPLS